MFFAIVFLLLWLLILWFAANYLINSSVRIAKYFNLSNLLIWLTIIAIWTSAPELFLSAMAAINWNWALSVGNVIWSNIFNLWFILWLSAIIAPILIQKKLVYRDGVFLVIITGIVLLMLWDQQVLWREGAILLSLLIGYNSYLRIKKEVNQEDELDNTKPKLKNLFYLFLLAVALSAIHPEVTNWLFTVSFGISWYSTIFFLVLISLFIISVYKKDIPEFHNISQWKLLNFIKLLASLWLLVISSERIVSAAIFIAQQFGISEWAIGATIVAAGTSLPEIAATVAAILKKKYDMWVGNVIWSDIFNILWIIGISSIIAPLNLTHKCIIVSQCDTWIRNLLFRDNIFSVGILFITMIITFLFMRTGWKLSKREWIFLFTIALIRMIFEINPNFFVRIFG